MKKTAYTIIMIMVCAFSAKAQFGEIRGKVTDKVTGETLPGANVIYYLGETMKGTITDKDGNYVIKPLTPGDYIVEFSFVGYNKQIVNNVKVSADKITFVDAAISTDLTLPIVEIPWEDPLIDPGIVSTMEIIDTEEIDQSVERDVRSFVATTGGVYQKEEGGSLNIRGSRDNSTVYVVDGIRMYGDFSLPKSAIQEITVLTGGIPAQFGDATGGVVLITTKSFRMKKHIPPPAED